MAGAGTLIVETRGVTLDGQYARTHEEVAPGDYVLVAVSDDGPGMAPDVLSRVLEPFFTTKEVGQGSGLGLSMIYGFAKQSGGHFSIYSEEGEGTSAKLYLPRSALNAEAKTGAVEQAAESVGGAESILVVEDDDALRLTVNRILKRLGYQVTLAEDGPQALTILSSSDKFDLLLTDVILPKSMNGPQLVQECVKVCPDLNILYMSGYTKEAIVQSGRLDQSDVLINKPFSPQELSGKVREILDGS